MPTKLEPINAVVPIAGKWDLSKPKRQTYEAPQAGNVRPFGICLSSVPFVEGEAQVTVKMPTFKKEQDSHGRFLIGYSGTESDYLSVGIGGSEFAYALYRFEHTIGWRPLVLCGSAENLRASKPYNLSVHVKGQRLVFKEEGITVIDHLLSKPVPRGQLGLFTWGPAPVEFENFCVREERGSAFMVMEFSEPYLSLYNDVIKDVAESEPFKLIAFHAGESVGRVILQDIVRGLEEARVVIAEITPANKNVFYELGYAHALGKAAILLVAKEAVKDLPFDLKGYRCIVYENTIAGKRHVQDELKKHLTELCLS
jgi:hypothetical protein